MFWSDIHAEKNNGKGQVYFFTLECLDLVPLVTILHFKVKSIQN
jgi:hypothetical protein